MSIAYGIVALISLGMVGFCVAMDKRRDVWLLLVFVSVCICNLGYFMLSISKDLDSALNSNRLSYLGSVFLPYFMLMMVLRFCRIKRNKWLLLSLGAIGVIMLGITTTPGVLPIYYSTVDIAFVDGATKLVREYGPLHLLYYIYLFGYMFSMVGIALFAIAKKRFQSRRHIAMLLATVFCNIIIWLVEQFLPRGFEWLSVSYIITEALILAIYRYVYRHGLVDAGEKTYHYTINVLLVVFLLLFTSLVRVVAQGGDLAFAAIADTVVLMVYVVILVFWGMSVYDRILNKGVRRYLVALVALMLLWMLLRTLRHTVFYYVFPIGQWCWYAYYISMILIPQLCLFAAKYIGQTEQYRLAKQWYLLYIPSLLLILGILTNDLHQWAFRFHLGYEIGWDRYQHNFLYYTAVAWIFSCIVWMIVEVVRQCRLPGTKKMFWMPIGMLGIGVLYSLSYATNSDIFRFIELTPALCFTVVAIWESIIKTGLIQSNSHYDELLRYSGLGVTVVDTDYKVHYRSEDALPLSRAQMEGTQTEPQMLDGIVRVSGTAIRGGHALWQEDVSELMEILEELTERREELKDSNALAMQNYQMNRQFRALVEKNRLHDELHRQTARQIDLLNNWLKELIRSEEPGQRKELLRRIVVVGAYLKRRNNLILVNEQNGRISAQELNLSVAEMMRNLQLAGIHSAGNVQFAQDLPADVAMRLFDFYESVVEYAFDGLGSLLARFFYRAGRYYCCVDVTCSLDLTGLRSEQVLVSQSDENCYTLALSIEGGDGK